MSKVEQESLPFEIGDSLLDRYERIDTIGYVEGFLPATRGEQTEVMTLVDEIGKPGGAARHLREVVIHQRNVEAPDPQAALRKITRNYVGYAADAVSSLNGLEELEDTLVDANPQLLLSRVITVQQPGLLALMRDIDLLTVRQNGGVDDMSFDPQKIDYSLDNPGIIPIAEMTLDRWTVGQARKSLTGAVERQTERGRFWVARLEEVHKYYPMLRPITGEGLTKIEELARAS